MTIRQELIRTARSAPRTLGKPAAGAVLKFLDSQRRDGGFVGRASDGKPDLYYSVFGLQAWMALQADQAEPAPPAAEPPVSRAFLATFGDLARLDFVHTCCLIRCWACLSELTLRIPPRVISALRERLRSLRLADGGFNHAGGARASAYGCFLALGAFQDLAQMEGPNLQPDPGDLNELPLCLALLRCARGGYANPPADSPSAPATAAALVALRHLEQPEDRESAAWLLASRAPDAGFRANELAPAGDLLSTGTALHALALARADLAPLREPTLDFVDALWSTRGAFKGHAQDDALDCEYAFYGLLALGALAS